MEATPPGVEQTGLPGGGVRLRLRGVGTSRKLRRMSLLGLVAAVVGVSLVLAAAPVGRSLGHDGRLALAFVGPIAGVLILFGGLFAVAPVLARLTPAFLEVDAGGVGFAEWGRWSRVPAASLRSLAAEVPAHGRVRRFDARGPWPDEADATADAALLVGVEGGWVRTLTHLRPEAVRYAAGLIVERFDLEPAEVSDLDPPRPLAEVGRGRGGAWVNAVMLALLGIGLAAFWYVKVGPAVGADGWPRVPAVVAESEIRTTGTGRRRSTRIEFAYAYSLDGVEHRGEDLGLGAELVVDVHDEVRARPAGTAIEVAVDPSDPTRSMLFSDGVPVMAAAVAGCVPAWLLMAGGSVMVFLADGGDAGLLRRYRDPTPRGPDGVPKGVASARSDGLGLTASR